MPTRFGKVASVLALSCALALLPATPASAGVHEGAWRGTTGQDRGIAFRVNGSEQVTHLVIRIEVHGVFCDGVVRWEASGRWPIRADDSFVISGRSGTDTLRVRGVFLGRARAEGVAKTSVIGSCTGSGRTQWKATKVL